MRGLHLGLAIIKGMLVLNGLTPAVDSPKLIDFIGFIWCGLKCSGLLHIL